MQLHILYCPEIRLATKMGLFPNADLRPMQHPASSPLSPVG